MNEKTSIYPLKDRWSYLWLAIGALVLLFSTGVWTIPLLTWLGSIFLIRFFRSQPVGRGFLLICLVNYIFGSIPWYPILGHGLPLPFFLIIMAVNTLTIGALPFLIDRLMISKLPALAGTLIYPLAVTTIEFLSLSTNPMGSIGSQAYTQYNSPVLMQLVSVTGLWGITFLVSWFATIANYCWEGALSWQNIKKGVVLYVGIMLVVLAYGNIRLAFPKIESGTMRVHGIVEMDGLKAKTLLMEAQRVSWDAYRELSSEIQEAYLEGTIREARQGAQLVVWPENAVWLAAEDEAGLVTRGKQIAQQEGVYVALGYAVEYQDSNPHEVKLVLIDPAGEVVLEHLKFGGQMIEGFRPGDRILRTVDTPYGTLSGIICWDTFFQKPVLQAGRNGTDILLSTSLEFREVEPMHSQITTFRAIENGVSLVRVADNGISFATDPYGRTVASVNFFTTSDRVMVAQVPAYHVTTVYAMIGDLFGWLAVVGFVGIIAAGVIRNRRLRQANANSVDNQSQPAPEIEDNE
jgi:apolipoprotein N-acyltransferase